MRSPATLRAGWAACFHAAATAAAIAAVVSGWQWQCKAQQTALFEAQTAASCILQQLGSLRHLLEPVLAVCAVPGSASPLPAGAAGRPAR